MTWNAIQSGAGGMPFSLATQVGDLVFVSGQASVGDDGAIISGTFEDEMHRAMGNLKRVLESAGVGLKDVVRATGYVREPANLASYNEIYREYFFDPFPARTTLTNCLPETLHFEIDVVAVRERDR